MSWPMDISLHPSSEEGLSAEDIQKLCSPHWRALMTLTWKQASSDMTRSRAIPWRRPSWALLSRSHVQMVSDAPWDERRQRYWQTNVRPLSGYIRWGQGIWGFLQSTPQRTAPALDGVDHLASLAHLANSSVWNYKVNKYLFTNKIPERKFTKIAMLVISG